MVVVGGSPRLVGWLLVCVDVIIVKEPVVYNWIGVALCCRGAEL